MLEQLVSLFLPKNLFNYFELIGITEQEIPGQKRGILLIELDENNLLPEGYSKDFYESKGFYSSAKIQDFPIRGKEVYLILRPRRWRSKEGKEDIKNDYSFVAEGTKITQELSDFLKELIESREDTISNIAYYHKIKAKKLRVHYKEKTL